MADDAVDQFDPSPAEPSEVSRDTPAPAAAFSLPTQPDPLEAMSERLLREMQDMRELLSRRQPMVESPRGTQTTYEYLLAMLVRVGFSAELSHEVLEALPEELLTQEGGHDAASAWLREQLIARLKVLAHEDRFFDQTGIVALVGPTGVGKTTTTAKLAARFVMRHGTRPVALVTTDSFRIGAHEQLRIYARLLDTPMYALDAEQPIDELVGRLQGKQWVIIDTVGTVTFSTTRGSRTVTTVIVKLCAIQIIVRGILITNPIADPGSCCTFTNTV